MTLADLIIEHGRWWPGQSVKELLGKVVDCHELNQLRDELIEMRAIIAKVESDQCGCLGGPLSIEWARGDG